MRKGSLPTTYRFLIPEVTEQRLAVDVAPSEKPTILVGPDLEERQKAGGAEHQRVMF